MSTKVLYVSSKGDITEHFYSISPREAVRAAFALSMGDANSWNWQKWDKYVVEGRYGFMAGDFWAEKIQRED
jgi:hypothetical protein